MRYDLTVPVKDLNGVQIADVNDPAGYTLRSVLVRTALFVDPRAAKPPTASDKIAAYALAKRLAQSPPFIELLAEEVAFLKAQAGLMWTSLVLGRVCELLEAPLTEFPEECAALRDDPLNADLYARMFARKPATDIPPAG